MKYLLLVSLIVMPVWSQTRSTAPVPPPPAPELAPDTVVAKVGGKPLTVADVNAMLDQLPPDLRDTVMQNPKIAISSWFLLEYLSKEALKAQLDQASPWKEQAAIQRRQLLAQAEISRRNSEVTVSDEELEKRYEAEKGSFDTVRLSAIFVAFADPKQAVPAPAPGEKPTRTLIESEALAKAQELARKARSGADFGQLARENSDDKPVAEKNGAFGVYPRASGLPDEIKKAIFDQKPGTITDPVKQGFGFYVLKVEEYGTQSFKDVRDRLQAKVRAERVNETMKALQKQFEVTVEHESFFGSKEPVIPVSVTPVTSGARQD